MFVVLALRFSVLAPPLQCWADQFPASMLIVRRCQPLYLHNTDKPIGKLEIGMSQVKTYHCCNVISACKG